MHRYAVTLKIGNTVYETEEFHFRIEAQKRFVEQVYSTLHLTVTTKNDAIIQEMKKVNDGRVTNHTVKVKNWSITFEALPDE